MNSASEHWLCAAVSKHAVMCSATHANYPITVATPPGKVINYNSICELVHRSYLTAVSESHRRKSQLVYAPAC